MNCLNGLAALLLRNSLDTINEISERLSRFLGLDKGKLYEEITVRRTEIRISGYKRDPPKESVREIINSVSESINDDLSNRIYPLILSASFLGAFSASNVPIEVFKPLKISEERLILSLACLLEKLAPETGTYGVSLEGLRIHSKNVEVDPNKIIGSIIDSEEASRKIVAETLYLNRVVSSTSNFLHSVLGLIMFSSGLEEAYKLSSRLRNLDKRTILSFLSIIGFYIGIPGTKKKIRKMAYRDALHRHIPITADILKGAMKRYVEKGYFSDLGVHPEDLIRRALDRRLNYSESKALALSMVLPLRRSTLSRMLDDDNIKLLVGDALSALYKSISHSFTSDQHAAIINIVHHDGIERISSGSSHIYSFLRSEFERFDIKYMEALIFELPFRLRLIKHTFSSESGLEYKMEASKALEFIYSLGVPVRRRLGYRLLTFLADALQSGRLSSAEIVKEGGKVYIEYSRSPSIAPMKRILNTNFPRLSEIFSLSRIVLSVLDRNSSLTKTERPLKKIKRLVKPVIKRLLKMARKYLGKAPSLEYINPIVLLSVPFSLLVSSRGSSFLDILDYIDFKEGSVEASSIILSRGESEGLFKELVEILEVEPYVIKDEEVHIFKALALSGLTLDLRPELGEPSLRPLSFEEIVKMLLSISSLIDEPMIINMLLSIASRFGHVSIYGLSPTIVNLAARSSYMGLVNSSKFFEVAPDLADKEVPADRKVFKLAEKGWVKVRKEDQLIVMQDLLNSFFYLIKEGFIPMVATAKGEIYLRIFKFL